MKCGYLAWWVHPSRPPNTTGCRCGMHGAPFTSAMAVALWLSAAVERAIPARAGSNYFAYWSKAIQPLLLEQSDGDDDGDDSSSDDEEE